MPPPSPSAPPVPLVRSRLTGTVAAADVARWAAALHAAVAALPDGTSFRLLLDLHGYEPADLDAHKAMRDVVPALLCVCGLRPAFADLFPEFGEPVVAAAPRVRCVAFANVHHDPAKMEKYERQIAKPEQRFFTDARAAEAWLAARPA
ncbi:hypothetical protein [Oleiharenicola sp. Vm1]|uniref:hypothetical protein n=1 Tax=Oleiharenicola sp. Vm1 TaxID=3398393 RepID=UPI0039F5404D